MNTPELAYDLANSDTKVVSTFVANGYKWALATQSDDQETVWAAYPEADSPAYKNGMACLVNTSQDTVIEAAHSEPV